MSGFGSVMRPNTKVTKPHKRKLRNLNKSGHQKKQRNLNKSESIETCVKPVNQWKTKLPHPAVCCMIILRAFIETHFIIKNHLEGGQY